MCEDLIPRKSDVRSAILSPQRFVDVDCGQFAVLYRSHRQVFTAVHENYDMNHHARDTGTQASVIPDDFLDTFAICAGPGIPAGVRRNRQVTHVVDVAATCADYLGLEALDFPHTSQSMRPLLEDGTPLHDFVLCQRFGRNGTYGDDHAFETYAAISRRWKVTWNGKTYRAFDLVNDPLEKKPRELGEDEPKLLQRLRAALQ